MEWYSVAFLFSTSISRRINFSQIEILSLIHQCSVIAHCAVDLPIFSVVILYTYSAELSWFDPIMSHPVEFQIGGSAVICIWLIQGTHWDSYNNVPAHISPGWERCRPTILSLSLTPKGIAPSLPGSRSMQIFMISSVSLIKDLTQFLYCQTNYIKSNLGCH